MPRRDFISPKDLEEILDTLDLLAAALAGLNYRWSVENRRRYTRAVAALKRAISERNGSKVPGPKV